MKDNDTSIRKYDRDATTAAKPTVDSLFGIDPWMPDCSLVTGPRSKDRSNAKLGHKEKVISSRRKKNKNAKMARKRNRH